MILSFALFFVLLGGSVTGLALKLWRSPDLDWQWTRWMARRRGLKSERTPEWERSRKFPLALLLVLGAGSLLGGVALATSTLREGARAAQREVRFDELAVAVCTLERVTIENRGSAPRFVTLGPVRAGTAVTTDPGWSGRPVALGLEALGDGVISSQLLLDVAGAAVLEIGPGERGSFALTAGSGACRGPALTEECTKLLFWLKSASAQGVSPELEVVRYCEL